MAQPAIEISGLAKQYQIRRVRQPYGTLRDAVAHVAAAPLRWAQGKTEDALERIWALRDVELSIDAGEVVGIIGRNGAGKSTLLKILARITEPTTGRVELRGRVASLLEVGTGFHLELTGRENVFLNGSILGMAKSEIEAKFDQIIAFAEVERFIDTPVKRYSSGMQLRLAFAVAAHLQAEILLIDEVLAVGDAAFQKKCLGKMGDVTRAGRTVLFVSHNMDAVRRLCSRVVWLDEGRVREEGSTETCIASYLTAGVHESNRVEFARPMPMANGMPVFVHAVSVGSGSRGGSAFSRSETVEVSIDWESTDAIYKPRIGFVLLTADGLEVLTSFDASSWQAGTLPKGRRVSRCSIPPNLLNEGEYVIEIGADGNPGRPDLYDFTASRTGGLLRFEVFDDMTLPGKYYGQEGFRDARWPGLLLLDLPWDQSLR